MKPSYIRLLAFSVTLIFLSSCSYKISRTGYSLEKTQYQNCEIPVKKFFTVEDSSAQIVGKIKLSDNGFSTGCNESKAIEILKGEACAREADLIVITEETRPDFKSSCYRCEAEFYRFGGEKTPDIESDINSYAVNERVEEDKKRNRTLFWVSFAIGFVIGFIAVQ